MSSRALSTLRAVAPLSLSLSLVGCSLAYCGDDAFTRERELRYGEIAGTALLPGPEPKPAAFVQANVRGTSFVRRTNSEGRFVFSGLQEGPWMVTVNEDADGDGKPERRRVVSAVLRQTPHRTSPSYVPFVAGEGQTQLSGVDVGEVLLEGTVRVSGRVLVDDGGGPVPPVEKGQVAVVVAGRNLDLPRLGSDGTDLVSLGAEAKTGVDDQGRFVLRNVSGGDVYLLVLVYEEGLSPGVPGALVQVSAPLSLRAEGERVDLDDDIVLPDELDTPRRPAQLLFSPPPSASEQVYLVLVPPGLEMPPCEDAPIDYSSSPFPYALTTAQIPAGAAPQFQDVPVGLWDMQACFTSSPSGTLFAQPVAPETPDELPVLLGPVLLSDLPACVPSRPCEVDADCGDGLTCDVDAGRCEAPEGWLDCDGDGARGLPPITNDDERALWAACVSACFEGAGVAAGDLTCDAPDGNTYDCDDDGDGQPDVTEAQECYGVGRGTDSDGDGICDGVDPFPECRANTAAACEAGAEPDVPTVPQAYAGDTGTNTEMCPVEREVGPAEEGERDWCQAGASGELDTCPIGSMRCSFTPTDREGEPPPPRCDAETGRGCDEGMECVPELANAEGIAPCRDVDAGFCEGFCERPGFTCVELEGADGPTMGCVSEMSPSPDVFGELDCECCPPGASSCGRGPNGFDTFWSPTICSLAELEELWERCHSGSGDPRPPTDGGVVDDAGIGGTDAGTGGDTNDAGQVPDDCVDVEPSLGFEPPPFGVACVNIVGGQLVLVGQSDLIQIDLRDVRELRGNLLIQGNPSLVTILAPALEVVRGAVVIDNNPVLTGMDLPALTEIDGDLGIWRNPQVVVPVHLAEDGPVTVNGLRRVSANACSNALFDCEPFGTVHCGPVPDPLNPGGDAFGGLAVCFGCADDNICIEQGTGTCDVDYFGSAGQGTYTCTAGGVPPSP